jgi:hypothetical protein
MLGPAIAEKSQPVGESAATEIFEHETLTWRVKRFLSRGEDIQSGMWIRLSYDPFDSKNPEVAQVHSCSKRGYEDFEIIVSRCNFPEERRRLLFSDGAFEEIEPLPAANQDIV